MEAIRFRPGALEPRIALAGASLRQVARDTQLALNTVLAANEGRPISAKTRYTLGVWLVEHPAFQPAELEELLVGAAGGP
jgi:hypothetical protein